MANGVRRYGHVLRREGGHVLREGGHVLRGSLDFEVEVHDMTRRSKGTWKRQVEKERMKVRLRMEIALC